MRIFNVIMLPKAESDLLGIIEYLNKFSPAIGGKYYDLIQSKVRSLAKMPLRQPIVRDERLSRAQVRWTIAKNYTIFFTVDVKNHTVYIERILYSRMAYDVLL